MSIWSIWSIVRAAHVLAGVFWAGGVFLVTLYVVPSIRAAGPAGGPVMRHLMETKKLSVAFARAAGFVVLTGLILFWRLGPAMGAMMHTPQGMALVTGAVAAILAMVLGLSTQKPIAERLGRLAAEIHGAPTPEQAATIAELQSRLEWWARFVVLLLVIAVLGMAFSHAF